MSDHVEVLAAIDRLPNVSYSALTPNVQGINKVVSLGKKGVDELVKIAQENNLPVRGSISCAVGCPYEGKISSSQVVPLVEKLLDMGCVSFKSTMKVFYH